MFVPRTDSHIPLLAHSERCYFCTLCFTRQGSSITRKIWDTVNEAWALLRLHRVLSRVPCWLLNWGFASVRVCSYRSSGRESPRSLLSGIYCPAHASSCTSCTSLSSLHNVSRFASSCKPGIQSPLQVSGASQAPSGMLSSWTRLQALFGGQQLHAQAPLVFRLHLVVCFIKATVKFSRVASEHIFD